MCGVFVDDKANSGWFLFYWWLMLLWVICLEFENICTVSCKGNVSRSIPKLYGWVYKNLKLSPLAVEHSVVVMTTGSQSRLSQIESYGFPSWGIRHWRSELDYCYDGLLICFSILLLWTLCGKSMRERQNAWFC